MAFSAFRPFAPFDVFRSPVTRKGLTLAQQIAALFKNDEEGAWYDPSDLTTLFQDSAGTVPVTGAEQPVRRMLDKSGNGHHAVAPSDAARPLLKQTAGGLWYLQFDGDDDQMDVTGFVGTVAMDTFHGMSVASDDAQGALFGSNSTGNYIGIYTTSTNLIAAVPPAYTPTNTRKNGASVDITNRTKLKAAIATGAPFVLSMQSAKMDDAHWTTKLIINGYAAAGFEPDADLYQLILRAGPSTASEIETVEQYIASKSGVTLL